MKIPVFVKVPFIALTLVYGGNFLAPQAAQAHHNPVHSTEQTVTKAVHDTSATVKQVAVKPASDTSTILPLTIGGAALLSLAGLGLYNARRKQPV